VCQLRAMSRGDLVRVIGLTARAELNGSHGLVVGPPDDTVGRLPVCLLGTSPIVGVNLRPVNMRPETGVPGNVRVQAWNDLGVAYSGEKMYSKAMAALEDALRVAREVEGVAGVREESCRSLSNIAWLCLVMNRDGVEMRGDATVKQVMEWAMRQMFHDVIRTLPADANVLFGAGRVPGKEQPHLIMTVVQNETPRYFVVDEDGHRVYEFSAEEDEQTPDGKDDC